MNLTKREFERDARKLFETLRARFPLEDWNLRLKCETIEGDDINGDVNMLPEYREAVIRVDPSKVTTVPRLRETLRHELLHVLTAEMELFWNLVKKDLPAGVQETHDRTFGAVWEMLVQRLERTKL